MQKFCKGRTVLILKLMRLSLLALFVVCSSVMSLFAKNVKGQEILDKKVTIAFKNESLFDALERIRRVAGVQFFYATNIIHPQDKVTVPAKTSTLGELLSEILDPYQLNYVVADNNKVVIRKDRVQISLITGSNMELSAFRGELTQKNIEINGRVVGESGEFLTGVTVQVKGGGAATKTDKKGFFRVSVPENAILVLSYVGYKNQEVPVKGNTTIEVVLHPVDSKLEEVVVVGYGTQKKVNLTGAVDQVGSEYFEDRSLPSVTRGMQGVIPNLNIKMTDGKPTRGASFNVRGATSIGSGGSALVLIDGVPGDPSTLNPNDIASVSVLKDASSAAIYGARGSFGVVLITTKIPKKDQVQITYNGSYSINSRTATPDLVWDGYTWAKSFDDNFFGWNDYLTHAQSINSQLPFSLEYLDKLKARHDDPNLPEYSIDPTSGRYEYYSNTDWFKELYRDRVGSTDHSLNISGGSEKVNYMISGRYYGQDGVFRYNPDDFKRYNLRFKGSVKVTDWLTLNSNTDFSTYSYKYPLTAVGGTNAVWRLMAVTAFPVSPLLNPDGTMTIVGAYSVGDFYYGKSASVAKQNFLRNTLGFDASVIKDKLSLKGDFSYISTNNTEGRTFFPVPYSIIPDQMITSGLNYLADKDQRINYYVANVYSDYKQKFGNHNINALVGWNLEYEQTANRYTQRDGLLTEDVNDFNLATGLNYNVTGGGNDWATVGVFYRLNYSFKDKYLVEFNGRYDGSSKFPTEQAFGFFPSASAGWKISEEHFMEGTRNWLNNLKLRASYGSLGNGNINPYTFLQTISSSRASVIVDGNFPNYISQPGVVPRGLTWEKATTLNFGLDADVLNRRLSLAFDWYQRNTTDMITVGPPLPAVFGAAVPKGNNADLSTKGWELSLTWNDQIATAKPIRYSFRLTLADNVSEITKFYNPNKLLSTYYKGQKIGEIWGYETLGLFASQEEINNHADQSFIVVSNSNKLLPGDLKFADRNKDGKVNNGKSTVDDPGDLYIIGNSSIRLPYGFTGNVDWNNFSLSFFFQGIGKRDWFPSTEAAFFWGQQNRPYSFLPRFNLNNYSDENPDVNAYFPRRRGYVALSGSRELAIAQTRYLQDASYIRLKNITLSYSLPKETLNRLKLSSLRVYVSGENLWTYSPMYKITRDFDPEVIEGSDPEVNANQGDGFSYPMQRAITFGVSLSF